MTNLPNFAKKIKEWQQNTVENEPLHRKRRILKLKIVLIVQTVYECVDKITQFMSRAPIFSFVSVLTKVATVHVFGNFPLAVHVPSRNLLLRACPYQGSYCACVQDYSQSQFMSRAAIFSFVPVLTKYCYFACVQEYFQWQFMSRAAVFCFVPVLTKVLLLLIMHVGVFLLAEYCYQGSYCACVQEYVHWQFMSRAAIFFLPNQLLCTRVGISPMAPYFLCVRHCDTLVRYLSQHVFLKRQ